MGSARFRFASGVSRAGLSPRRILGMRLFDIARIAALISCGALLSACPKKDTEAAPEPAASAAPAAVQAPVNDKAGAEPPRARSGPAGDSSARCSHGRPQEENGRRQGRLVARIASR